MQLNLLNRCATTPSTPPPAYAAIELDLNPNHTAAAPGQAAPPNPIALHAEERNRRKRIKYDRFWRSREGVTVLLVTIWLICAYFALGKVKENIVRERGGQRGAPAEVEAVMEALMESLGLTESSLFVAVLVAIPTLLTSVIRSVLAMSPRNLVRRASISIPVDVTFLIAWIFCAAQFLTHLNRLRCSLDVCVWVAGMVPCAVLGVLFGVKAITRVPWVLEWNFGRVVDEEIRREMEMEA